MFIFNIFVLFFNIYIFNYISNIIIVKITNKYYIIKSRIKQYDILNT